MAASFKKTQREVFSNLNGERSEHLKIPEKPSTQAAGCANGHSPRLGHQPSLQTHEAWRKCRQALAQKIRSGAVRPKRYGQAADCKHILLVPPNVLARQFEKPLPNLAWVCRHHLNSHAQRLAVSGSRTGFSFTQDGGLGNSIRDARNGGGHALANGYSISAIPLPALWCIWTGGHSPQAPSIKGC